MYQKNLALLGVGIEAWDYKNKRACDKKWTLTDH